MNDKAMDKFLESTHDSVQMLKDILEHMENHMDASPEEINWGHVGSAGHVAEKLSEITEFLNL